MNTECVGGVAEFQLILAFGRLSVARPKSASGRPGPVSFASSGSFILIYLPLILSFFVFRKRSDRLGDPLDTLIDILIDILDPLFDSSGVSF